MWRGKGKPHPSAFVEEGLGALEPAPRLRLVPHVCAPLYENVGHDRCCAVTEQGTEASHQVKATGPGAEAWRRLEVLKTTLTTSFVVVRGWEQLLPERRLLHPTTLGGTSWRCRGSIYFALSVPLALRLLLLILVNARRPSRSRVALRSSNKADLSPTGADQPAEEQGNAMNDPERDISGGHTSADDPRRGRRPRCPCRQSLSASLAKSTSPPCKNF